MTTLFSKIKEVTELSAISGHEAPVRAYLREKITPHMDEVVKRVESRFSYPVFIKPSNAGSSKGVSRACLLYTSRCV